MSLLLSVRPSWRVMKDKYPKLYSILKELKFFQRVSIILLDSGMRKEENSCKCWRATRTRYSPASSTTRAILSSLDRKTTPAKFGGTRRPSKSLNPKNDSQQFQSINSFLRTFTASLFATLSFDLHLQFHFGLTFDWSYLLLRSFSIEVRPRSSIVRIIVHAVAIFEIVFIN